MVCYQSLTYFGKTQIYYVFIDEKKLIDVSQYTLNLVLVLAIKLLILLNLVDL